MEDTGRYFIVGSARSGTTLLQAMVAAHPRVHSLPETHFFCEAVSGGKRGWLGLARRSAAREALEATLKLLGRSDRLPSVSPFLRPYVKAFVDIMDRAAVEHGRDIWVEKTPHHISYLPLITKTVRGARFIHILRDGRDVLASQRYAMRQDSAYWSADRWPLNRMIDLWNTNTRTTLDRVGEPGHLVVLYEALVREPEATLSRVSGFMGMDFDQAMLRHWEAADAVVGWRKSHPWMANAFKPLMDTHLRKFHRVFSIDEQTYVVNRLLAGGEAARLLRHGERAAA